MKKKKLFKKAVSFISAIVMAFSSSGIIVPVHAAEADDNNYQLVKDSLITDNGSNPINIVNAWSGYPDFNLWAREIFVQSKSNQSDTRSAWCVQPGIPTYTSDIYTPTSDYPANPGKYSVEPDYEAAKRVLAAYYANHFSYNSATKDLDSRVVGSLKAYTAVQLAVWTKVMHGDINQITVKSGYEDVLTLAKALVSESDQMTITGGTNLVTLQPGNLNATVMNNDSEIKLNSLQRYALSGYSGYYYGTDLISVEPKQTFLTFDRTYNVSLSGAPEGTIIAANTLSGEESGILAKADSSGNTPKVSFGFNTDNGTTFRIFVPESAAKEDLNITVSITDGNFYRTDFQYWVSKTSRQSFISTKTSPETFAYTFHLTNQAEPDTPDEPEPYLAVGSIYLIKGADTPVSYTENEDGVKTLNWENRQKPGATFALYYDEDFTDTLGRQHNKGELIIDNVTTGANGYAIVKNIPVKAAIENGGFEELKIKIVETDTPLGYSTTQDNSQETIEYTQTLLSVYCTQDVVDGNFDCTENDIGKVVGLEAYGVENGVNEEFSDTGKFIPNYPILLSLNFKKVDEDGDPVKDAVFGLYTNSEIIFPANENGEVKTLPAGSLVAKMTSDENGNVVLPGENKLPAGMTYTLKELSVPEGYELTSSEFLVEPDENGDGHIFDYMTDTASTCDEYINSDAAEADPNHATASQIDINNEITEIVNKKYEAAIKLVKVDVNDETPLEGAAFELKDSSGKVLETKTTDANGEISFDTKLSYKQEVVIEETKAPEGYQLADPVTVTADDAATTLYTVTVKDEKVPYYAHIYKVDGESGKPLKGAEFTLYEKGNDTPIETAVSDENGIAKFTSELSQYKEYYAVETKAPENYEIDSAPITIQPIGGTAVENDDNLLIRQYTAKNAKMVYSAEITKTDSRENGGVITGAEFTLYASDDKDFEIPLATAVTDENGVAEFTGLDIEKSYVAVETKAPEGYLLSDEKIEITPPDTSKDTGTKHVSSHSFTNQKEAEIKVVKQSESDSTYLKGAEFTIYDAAEPEKALETKVTGEDGTVTFTGLDFTKEYIISETKAPLGYSAAEDQKVSFTDEEIKADAIVHTVTFLDTPLEFSVQVIKKDSSDTSKTIEGAEFTIYDAEDKNFENPIAAVTTDKDGVAKFDNLPVDRNYVIKETKAPEGYRSSDKLIEVNLKDLYFTSGDTENFEVEPYIFENDPMRVNITVQKVSTDGTKKLAGAHFSLYRAEDEDLKEPVATLITDKNGEATAENLVRGSYVLVETKAPNGYELNPKHYTVDVSKALDLSTAYVTVTDEMTPGVEPGTVIFSKRDINGQEIEGAELRVTDKEGVVYDSWTSESGKSHEVELMPGDYIFEETKVPYGYSQAAPIEFSIDEKGNVTCDALENGKIVMIDTPKDTPAVQFSKQDVGGNEIEGAKLVVLDSENKPVEVWVSEKDKTHSVVLGPGKYTLVEMTAPAGYEIAESITFEITDNGEVVCDALKDGKIVMVDKPSGETATTGISGNNTILGIGLVTAGAIVLIGAIVFLVKKRKK